MRNASRGLARLRPGLEQARLWARFLAAMFGFGLSIALMVRSQLGLGPWDAFHAGIHHLTGMTIGTASILTGLLIVAGMRAAGEPPRLGTLVNMFAIGVCLDLLLPFVPAASGLAAKLAYSLTAIGLAGLCTGLYIGTGLGRGARDGLSLWLSGRTRLPVRRVRTLVELVVLAGGWAMGGTIGLGTVLFSLLIGVSMEQGLRIFGVPVAPARDAPGTAADRQAA